MKKTSFRLQPRFQVPLEHEENQDDNGSNYDDDISSVLSRWGLVKERRKRSEINKKRMKRRQNADRDTFLKSTQHIITI